MAYCCHFFCVWFTKLCVSQLNSQESIHRILCLCARKCKNKAVVNVWYGVARFSNTRKIPQYPAKNNTIPHFICTLRSVLSEWEPYYVRQSIAVSSTLLHPPVPAGRVGVPSLFSYVVFMATKLEVGLQVFLLMFTATCQSRRTGRNMALFCLHGRQSGIAHELHKARL